MQKNWVFLGLLAFSLGLGWQFGLYRQSEKLESKQAALKDIKGQVLPIVDWADLDGAQRKLSEWQGKVLVINHWATWCPPCREEIPMFMDYRAQNAERGLEIIGIAHDDEDEVRRYVDSMGIAYPQLLSGVEGQKWLARLGASGGLPHTLIFDKEGKLRSQKLGLMSQDDLHNAVEPLL